MSDIHIAGTGIWYPEDKISNTELVESYNNYVRRFNIDNSKKIDSGDIVRMEESSVEFIVKASGIESRHVIDKDGILDIDRMMPKVVNEDHDKLSIHAQAGIKAAIKAMNEADVTPEQIDAVIVGTSHSVRNYPAVAIEIQNELDIKVMHMTC